MRDCGKKKKRKRKHILNIVSKGLPGPKILSELSLKIILAKLQYESWSPCVQTKSNIRLRQISLYKYKSTSLHINLSQVYDKRAQCLANFPMYDEHLFMTEQRAKQNGWSFNIVKKFILLDA